MKNDFNQEEVKLRIISLQKDKDLTATAFARLSGIDPANYSKKAKGQLPFTKLDVKKICEKLGVKGEWLAKGIGEKYELTYTTKYDQSTFPSNAITSIEVEEFEYAGENKNDGIFFSSHDGILRMSVPHVPYAARAEFANLAEDLEPHLENWEREVYIVDKKVNGKYLSFDVKGDSMDNGMKDCLEDGDKVLVRELERDFWRDLHVNEHKYWVLVFGSSILIKQILSEDVDNGTIVCHSLNPSPEYHDFTLNLDDVRLLYYVVKIKPKERSV